MASLFDKIKDIFKPNTQTTTPAATQQSTPARTITNVANRPVGTQRVFAPASQPSAVAQPTQTTTAAKAQPKFSGASRTVFGKNETSTSLAPVTSIGSKGSLSERAIKNGQSKGEDWSKASTAQKKYNETYYRTLDNPTHTKMYTDLESAIRTRKDAAKSYSAGRDQLDSELDFVKKQYGKESNEYKALKQFIGDYEDLGRQMSANQAYDSASKASREMDQTIDTIFSGVINSPDYRAKVEEGRKKIEANPVVYHRYKLALDAASDKQRDLMYYTFNEEGDKGARDFFDRFMGDTLNYEKAAKDFASDVTTKDTKASRFWEANKANWASAIDGQFGTGVRQTLKNTKADPNDKTLVGDYNISDSVDDYLRSQIGGNISDDDLSTYGAQGYSQLRYSDSDWLKEADKDASEYQKNMLGYLYLAYQSEDAAREAWDEIKQRSDAIWQTVNGSNSVATAASTAEGQLYRDYLGLAGADMPEWLGNPGQDTDLTVAQAVWDMAQTTRAQYPQIAANIVGAMAGGPAVGRVLGAAVMSTSAYGNAYKQAVDEGKNPSAAAGYAATQAASEFAVGMLLDGVAPIAGALTGNAGMKFVQNIANPFVKAVVNAGVRGLGEGTEEYIQEIAEPLIRNFWFKENNEFELFNEEAAYSFFLGAISALAMSPMSTNTEIKLNKNFAKIGNALNYQGSTEKLVDMILNNPVEGDKKSVKLYEEAKDLAEKIKNGTIKATDINAGELLSKYAEAGGDIGFLTDPETVAYTKETIGLDDMVAGATSMLSELGEDTALAADIAKLAMGETITEEAQTRINESAKAQEVLSQLQGDLDMESNNALARAARATVFKGALNKIYSTLKNSNPDKNVITPAAQMLYDSGVEIKQAEKIGDVFNKVLDGQKLTANEAKLVKASSPAIRAAALQILGIDLSEYAGADMVLSQLNELAETTAKVKEQQAAVKRAAKPAAKARGAAMQGGNAYGQSRLQQNDQGGAAGLARGPAQGTGSQGVSGGASQESGGFEGTGRQTHHLRRAGQRSRIDSAHAERSRGGSQRSGVSRYVPLDEYTEEEKALQERGVKRGAQNVLIVEGMDATTGYNPALGGYFILLPRDGQFSVEEYADHEPVHLWVDYALTPERRKVVLDDWVDSLRAAMGDDDFQTFYDFIYKVYNDKGYFGTEAEGNRLTDDAIMYRIYADMLAFCHAGQAYGTDVNGVDPSQYKALARQFVDDYNLEAIGTGDMSNPAVREAIDNDWVDQEYYDRQGFNQTDSTEIDVGVEPAAEQETTAEQGPNLDDMRAKRDQLTERLKELQNQRKQLIANKANEVDFDRRLKNLNGWIDKVYNERSQLDADIEKNTPVSPNTRTEPTENEQAIDDTNRVKGLVQMRKNLARERHRIVAEAKKAGTSNNTDHRERVKALQDQIDEIDRRLVDAGYKEEIRKGVENEERHSADYTPKDAVGFPDSKILKSTTDLNGKHIVEAVRKFFSEAASIDENGDVVNDIIQLWLASNMFGFTAYDTSKSDDGISIFLSDNPNVGKSYAYLGSKEVNQVEYAAMLNYIRHTLRENNPTFSGDLPLMGDLRNRILLDTSLSDTERFNAVQLMADMYNAALDYQNSDKPRITSVSNVPDVDAVEEYRIEQGDYHDAANDLWRATVKLANYAREVLDWAENNPVTRGTKRVINEFADAWDKYANPVQRSLSEAHNRLTINPYSQTSIFGGNDKVLDHQTLVGEAYRIFDSYSLKHFEDSTREFNHDMLESMLEDYKMCLEAYYYELDFMLSAVEALHPAFETEDMEEITDEDIYEVLPWSASWAVYANTSKMLVIDGTQQNGRPGSWAEIDMYNYPEYRAWAMTQNTLHGKNYGVKKAKTRDIAAFAKARGYNSVVIKNIYDLGGQNIDGTDPEPSNIYCVFLPNQIKSIYNEDPTLGNEMQHSADYDAEYYQSVGLINQDGSTASFTDNIGGVHEEILNQMHGTEGEDIKDFIARGGIRVKPNVGIELNEQIEPTFKQYDVIDNVVKYFTGKTFSIDFNLMGAAHGTHTFEGFDIDPSRIYTYLRNFYQRRRSSVLDRYTEILGMPVKTMKDAYNVAKFQIQMDGDDPELQEIIDAYENQRYSADYGVEKFAEDFDTNEYLNETTELELDGFEIEGADSDIDEYVMAGGPTDLAGAPITNDVRNFFGRAQSYDKRTYEVVNRIIPLYLATDNLGFSAYDPTGKSDDGRSIFLTDNRAVGATYGKKGDNLIDMKALGALREHIASELGYKDFDDLPLPTTLAEDRSEDSIRLLYKMYNALLSYKGKTPWIKNKGKLLPVQVRSKLSNLRTSFPQINDLADEANYSELRLRKADPDSVITEALLSTVATVKEKIQSLLKANEAGNADIRELLNLILKCRNVIDDTAAKLGTSDEISDRTRMEVLAALGMVDAVVSSSATSLADALADGVFFPVTDTAGNRVEVSEVLNALADSGSWAVYANTTNPLVVWGEGSWWSDLADAIAGEEWEEDFWEWYDNYEYKDFDLIHPHINTRAIANYAYERGYDSAIMIDVHDKGGYRTKLPGGGKQPSTIYVVFNPNQIKSVNNKHPSQDRRMNYSADYLDNEDFDAQLASNALTDDIYRNDIWEVAEDNPEDKLQAEFDALFAELDAFPEREAEIMAKIGALQNKNMIRTAKTDDITTEEQENPQEDYYKDIVNSGAKTERLKSPVEKAFQPKAEEKVDLPTERNRIGARIAELEDIGNERKLTDAELNELKQLDRRFDEIQKKIQDEYDERKKTATKEAFKPKKVTSEPVEKTEEKKPIPIPKAKPEPVDNGVSPEERSEYEQLKAELEANPELADDPAFLPRAAALIPKMAKQMTATAEKAAQLEAQEAEAAEETATEETQPEPEAQQVITVADTTKYARKDKKGGWWHKIGAADSIEIRRRRSDRNTFDVRITDAKGNTVTYDEVSPAMLTKAFGVKTGDRAVAMERAKRAAALAQNVSLNWSKFDNPKVEKVAAPKAKPNRSKDNLGREVPVRLSQYMGKSAIRTADGALINTYRLAAENGVHNARPMGKFSMFTERPASMNIQRGMTGAAAYGQSQKSAGAKLEAIFDKLADPKTSKAEVESLRKQIAQLEEENKKYVSGITRLDPTRPDFQFAQRENIVNGKSVLETYLDIRKPKVIDAKGQGLDFVTREVRNFVNNPENKAGQFDANRDPIGPNDGFKFTNVNVVPEGQTLGGGDRDLDTVYVTLRNNQAKSTYNTSPTTSDLLQYSADYDAMVEEDAMSKGILEKRPTGFTDAKGYSISSDQAWLFDEAKMLDKEGHLVKGILPLYGGSKSMHLMWDPKTARKTKALYLATNPKVSEGYTKVPENQGKVADLMAYEQLIAKLANAVKMNADTLVEKIPALKKFAAGTDRYADEGARRLVVMYNNAISKDNPMRGKAELIPTDGKEPPRVKYADGTTSAATNIPNFLPAANIRMFYANTTNPFVIYGNHANWRHIYMGNNKAFMDWKKRVWDQPGYEEFEMKPDSTYVDTDTIVQYVLEETPNDSVIFHDIMDAIGQHPDGYGDVYVVFNPDQAKSVNNRHPTLDPRYNHSADYDAKVFGDMEDRGIIEKKPGDHDIDGNYISPVQASYFDQAKSLDRDGNLVYGVIPLFHGGRSIYLVWDPDKAKDSRAFFLTTNPAVAETYMQTYGKSHLSPGEMVDLVQYEAKLEEITNKLGIGDAASALTMLAKYIKSGTPSQKASAAETYAEIYNELMGDEYGKITPVESNKASQMQQTLDVLEEDQYVFGDRLVELEDVMDSATDEELISKLNAFHDAANDLFFAVADLRTADDFDWGTTYHADTLARLVANSEPIVDPETGEILNWRIQEQAKRLAEQIDALDKLIMDDDEVLFENEGMDGFWSTFDDLPPILPGTGVSAFYANTTNPLVVDGTTTDWLTGEAQPGDWTHIDVSKNPELSRAFPRGYASTDEIAEYARAHDYDSVIIHNIYDLAGEPNDGSGAGDVYMVFSPNQIKSVNNRFPTEDPRYNHSADYTGIDTGYADGSLEDTILKILWDKDEERATAALIEYFYQFMQTGEIPQMENEKTRNIFQPRVTPGEAEAINDQFKKFVEEYGALEKGANPARDVVFPKKTDTGYARRFFRTAAESKNTPEWTMDALKREFLLGSGTYQRITDKSAIAYADRELQRKGYDKVLAEWQGKIDAESRLTKNDVAIGEALLIEAETAGDMETAMRLIAELAEVGTTAGQTVQAFSMLKKMPKAYQLYYFQRVANRLNRQYAKRLKNGKTIKLNSKLAKAVLNAKTKEDLDKAINALIQDIANQVPVNTADRWNAWRYLSMLGNPKTHIRNYLGNSVFIPAKFAKDLIAAGLETTLIKDPSKRNTSFRGLLDRRGTAEYRAFAEEDYEGIKQDLQSGGKYNPTNAVMEARTIFKTPLLEKLRKLNGEWLEKEDGIFLKFHYVNAMTNFLSTRGVSIKELQSTREGRAVLNAARQFAFTEAQKATYRDASAVAAALNQLKRVPVIGVLAEGMLPFTKTPINILKRGVEYSPIGLLDTATRLALKLKNEEITANEFVDKLASGLTGTGIALIGFWLASQGLLKGGDDDDDKQADADKLMGYQNYSINIGKTNYTIDWMAPSALPLFVGAAVFSEMREKNGITGADFYNAMTAIAEPITQLSMLSGLNDTLKSAKWDDNPFASVVQSMGAGYISQGLPTILGQVARSFTENRRTTYVDKNSDIPQPLQRWMQTNVMGKVPGLNNQRAEYIDTWGRKDTTQSFLLRVFDNAISPGYRNEIEVTPVDAELQRLAKEVGTGVLVSPAERSIEFNNEKHNLTAEQYETYAKVRGNSMFSMLNELFNSAAYQGLTDEEKAKAVDYLKDYGNVLGKQAVFPEYEPTTDNWAEKCDGDMNRLINSTLLKAEANAAGVKYDNYDPYYSLVINSSWLAPVEQGYALAQQYDIGSTKSVYIRKGGPKYEVTPERKDVLYYHYRQIFPGYYVELAASDQWRNANNEKRLELLSDLRAKVNASNKAWLAQQLYDSGAEQYTG